MIYRLFSSCTCAHLTLHSGRRLTLLTRFNGYDPTEIADTRRSTIHVPPIDGTSVPSQTIFFHVTAMTAAASAATLTTMEGSGGPEPQHAAPVKGRSVSGRTWKTRPQKRASSLVKTATNNLSTSWATKLSEKRQRQEAASLQKELKEIKRQEAIAKKERRLANEKRRAENEFKAVQSSVQSLNHDKVGVTLKAMSKKQLRQIKKTRMNPKTGVVEYVSAYAK